MQTAIFQEIIDHGDRGVILPIDRLNDLKKEFNKLRSWCNIFSVKSRTLTKVVSQKYPSNC